jgi:flagellar biogenesis protein FliO
MSQRTRLTLVAACSLLFATSVPARGDQALPAISLANDSAVIKRPGPASPDSVAQPRATEEPATAGLQRTAAAEPSPDGPFTPPTIEDKALGVPNGLLSARPAAPIDPGEAGVLGALDPRRSEIVRVGLALGAVIVVLLLIRGVIRRGASSLGVGSRPSGVVEVLARYPVARHQQLMLLKLGRRIVLLHHGSGRMAALTEITDPDEVASLLASLEAGSRQREAMRFRSILKSFEREHASQEMRSADVGRRSGKGGDEIIDLTRGGSGSLGGWFARRRSTA